MKWTLPALLLCLLAAVYLAGCFSESEASTFKGNNDPDGDTPEDDDDGDTPEDGDVPEDGDEPECDCPSYPRWVLRDKDDVEVREFVSPAPIMNYNSDSFDFGDIREKRPMKCFVDESTGAMYHLTTGEMHNCYPLIASDINSFYFADPECNSDIYHKSAGIFNYDGVIIGAWGSPELEAGIDIYNYECMRKTSGYPLWRLRQLPDEILNRYPNPPYTISIER